MTTVEDHGTVKLPPSGIGLRAPHIAGVMATRPAVGWFEVHAENFMSEGPGVALLLQIRRDYPLSLHGVGLSLGSVEGIDRAHLRRLKRLVDVLEPELVSEHVSWSVNDGVYLNDLLPLPYTEEALDAITANVRILQDTLGRRVLLENPSSYLRFSHTTLTEAEFLAALLQRTGCGLLCDLNNIYVSAVNLMADPTASLQAYLQAIPAAAVGEIHLAGHFCTERAGQRVLIDDHGSAVVPQVWELYRLLLRSYGAVPTLIERDTNIPALDVLVAEAHAAEVMARELTGDFAPARAGSAASAGSTANVCAA